MHFTIFVVIISLLNCLEALPTQRVTPPVLPSKSTKLIQGAEVSRLKGSESTPVNKTATEATQHKKRFLGAALGAAARIGARAVGSAAARKAFSAGRKVGRKIRETIG
ncbi:unnamed protein product [Heligmosomoides polygyrus]|uniref:Secreted protein n=1 Tax=Heligmosomoides polygyrus TaxID=6339 RepID=A0A183GM37_HELPZ|nr:unnamed protein product [Heligmosomoides polygyrus]